jgi:hypothetical protein
VACPDRCRLIAGPPQQLLDSASVGLEWSSSPEQPMKMPPPSAGGARRGSGLGRATVDRGGLRQVCRASVR